MKNIPLFCLTLYIILSLYLSNGYAQDYAEWGLPEGAKMRLGKGEINDIKFSPDGKRLAVGTSIGIWIYDVNSRKEVTFLKSDKYQIDVLMFIENGMKIVSVGIDGPIGRIITWEVETETIPEKPNIPEIGDQLSGTGYFWASALSHDGNLLAIGNGSGSINLWDLRTRNKISSFKAHSDPISGLTFSPDGSTLVSGSDDSKIHLWNVATQKHQETLTRSFGAHALAFSSDGKRFASGGWDATIRLWDTDTGNQIAIITGHPHFVEEMAFAPDGNIAAGTARGVTRLWYTNTTSLHLPNKEIRSRPISILAFSNNSETLLSMSGFTIQALNVVTNHNLLKQTMNTGKRGYSSIAFSTGRTKVAASTIEKKIRIWDIASGNELMIIRPGFKKAIIALAFSPDGKILTGAGKDGPIRAWSTTTRKLLFTLNGHTKRVESLAFSPDGKTLASGSWDGTMRLWDIETKTQISQRGDGFMGGIIEVQFSLDGKTVVSSSQSNRIQLWQVENKRQTPTVMLTGHNGWIRNIEFSADGKTFASGSDDGTILLWDWEKCSKLKGHNRY
ncbi:MAG: hypothetical protein OXM61_03865 [Candidatus Poribacteria bacterium]|nr:hypothetical protein [Candidatus Poribacteria bacterium]